MEVPLFSISAQAFLLCNHALAKTTRALQTAFSPVWCSKGRAISHHDHPRFSFRDVVKQLV